jgi:acyl transferase domain-containing protein
VNDNDEELLAEALSEIERLEAELAKTNARSNEDLAIVGLGIRFPGGVNDLSSLWRVLAEGQPITSEQRPTEAGRFLCDPSKTDPNLAWSTAGAYLPDVEMFDAEFFGISAPEANVLDPQHRLALELAWECMEDAGIPLGSFSPARSAVVLGTVGSDFATRLFREGIRKAWQPYFSLGVSNAAMCNRVASMLGISGPSYAVGADCASILLAIQTAAQYLWTGAADFVLAGAVFIGFEGIRIAQQGRGMLAADGIGRYLTDKASGPGSGEGGGVFVLKRLSSALENGDRVYGVIAGMSSGVSPSFFPGLDGAARVARCAQAYISVRRDDVQYAEVPGVCVTANDALDIEVLGELHRRRSIEAGLLRFGAAAPILGWSYSASGAASIAKVLACFRAEQYCGSGVGISSSESSFDWEKFGVALQTNIEPWWRNNAGKRVASLETKGIGELGGHLLLVDPKPRIPCQTEWRLPGSIPLCISAKNLDSVRRRASQLADFLASTSSSLLNVAHTLALHRTHLAHRALFWVHSIPEAVEVLNEFASKGHPSHHTADTLRVSLLGFEPLVDVQVEEHSFDSLSDNGESALQILRALCVLTKCSMEVPSHLALGFTEVGHDHYSAAVGALELTIRFRSKEGWSDSEVVGRPSIETVKRVIERSFLNGLPVLWDRLFSGLGNVPLPSYPWSKQQYWPTPL